jgi:hypothetical protein
LIAACSALAASCFDGTCGSSSEPDDGVALEGAPDMAVTEWERRASACTVRVANVTTSVARATDEQPAINHMPRGAFGPSLRDFHLMTISPFYQLDTVEHTNIGEIVTWFFVEK